MKKFNEYLQNIGVKETLLINNLTMNFYNGGQRNITLEFGMLCSLFHMKEQQFLKSIVEREHFILILFL